MKADIRKRTGGGALGLQRSSYLPAGGLSSLELSEESVRSVQHGAFSIPPAGCLGPVWGGLLTTGPPDSSQHPHQGRPLHTATSRSSAALAAAGFEVALAQACRINIYSIRF